MNTIWSIYNIIDWYKHRNYRGRIEYINQLGSDYPEKKFRPHLRVETAQKRLNVNLGIYAILLLLFAAIDAR